MNPRFDRQRVLVIGGSSGIGLAAARAFADSGATVTIAARSADKLADAARASGGALATAQLDGSDAAAVEAFFARQEAFEHLVLCANAGGTIGPLSSLDLDAMRGYFDNKLWVYLHALRYGAARVVPGGSVTLVNGAASRIAVPGMSALAVVNGGLDALVRPLALELAPTRVNAVSPGVIESPYWERMAPADRARMYEQAARAAPTGRVGTAQQVAQAVLFLAGNGYVDGTVLLVDGGRHLTPRMERDAA